MEMSLAGSIRYGQRVYDLGSSPRRTLFQANAFPENPASPAAKGVARYADALRHGFAEQRRLGGLLTNNMSVVLFQMLKRTDEEFRSTPGTALKNDQTGEMVYVPPQGIPMDQVIVEERATSAAIAPPRFKIEEPASEAKAQAGESEWMRNLVGRETKVHLLVSGGEMRPKEIGRLIKLLEAQKDVLMDVDDLL